MSCPVPVAGAALVKQDCSLLKSTLLITEQRLHKRKTLLGISLFNPHPRVEFMSFSSNTKPLWRLSKARSVFPQPPKGMANSRSGDHSFFTPEPCLGCTDLLQSQPGRAQELRLNTTRGAQCDSSSSHLSPLSLCKCL